MSDGEKKGEDAGRDRAAVGDRSTRRGDGYQGGKIMKHWMWLFSLVGISSTAVVFGTDMFFLTVGRPALRLAAPSAGTAVMGFFHMFADARMPIWGVSAILSNFLLVVLTRVDSAGSISHRS